MTTHASANHAVYAKYHTVWFMYKVIRITNKSIRDIAEIFFLYKMKNTQAINGNRLLPEHKFIYRVRKNCFNGCLKIYKSILLLF